MVWRLKQVLTEQFLFILELDLLLLNGTIRHEYLFNCTDTNTARSNLMLTYDKYRRRIEALVDALELNPDHRAHDGRNTFITMCKNAGVDEYAIKTMVGHEIYDITEKVYTKRDPQWLHNEILKIQ